MTCGQGGSKEVLNSMRKSNKLTGKVEKEWNIEFRVMARFFFGSYILIK